MIEWKPFNPEVAQNLEENDYLLFLAGIDRVVSATHDAMDKCFFYPMEVGNCVYAYRDVLYYAELNVPWDDKALNSDEEE